MRIDSILFACNRNSLRSPMAAALTRRAFGARFHVASCGVDPASRPDLFAVQIMRELDIDIADHRPIGFEDLEETGFDLVVSFTPEAHHRAATLTRHLAADIEYWPTPDPMENGAPETRDAILDAYRSLREALWTRIQARFGDAPAAVG